MPESILDWGINLILYLQTTFPWALGTMELFTLLGHEYFYFFVLPIFLWAIDMPTGVRLAVFIGVTNVVNLFFKVIFNDPRPYWYDSRVKMLAPPETGFGIPSGHAQNAVIVWGSIGMYFKRNWLNLIVIFIVIMIGLSRIFLAAHFPTDVIVGWIFGFVILWLALRLEGKVSAWFSQYSGAQKILIVFGIALGAILINGLLNGLFQDSIPLEEWTEIASVQVHDPEELPAPFSLNGIITTVSAIFGIIAGYILLMERGGYSVNGPFWQRALRVVVGLVGVVVFMFGLDIIFALITENDTSILGMVLRFVRYGSVGLWMGYLGPLTFIKLKLAEPG